MQTDTETPGFNRLLFIITLLAGTFTMSISQSSLSTAYPTLMKFFNIPASSVQWLTTGFMLIMCVMMPVSPWLLSNMNFKSLFLFVLALFDIGTLVIYLAPNFPVMLIGRALEAVGVGILFPSFQVVLLRITPEKQRGSVMGAAGLVMGSALAVGPIISGIVLHYMTWQGLFLVFMVIITIILLLATVFIQNVMPLKPTKLDMISVICLVGFIGILYVINLAGQTGVNWTNAMIILLISVLAVTWFVVRQFKLETPLLNLRVLKTFNFDLAVLLTGASYIALIVVTIIFPLYYQTVLGVSPFISGMALVPGAVFLSILNPLTGKLADRVGFKVVMLIGMTMIVIGWGLLALLYRQNSLVLMMILAALIEGGNAFVMMPAVTLGANSLPDDLISHGTAVITTTRQILGSTGVMVATLVLANSSAHFIKLGFTDKLANLGGFHTVFFTFFIIEVVGLFIALLLRDTKERQAE
ncbi:MFS transporter [Secundilactobacillus oryzae]|nr:MFS transporter [Secundilactobacillus oryzae]